MLGEEPTFGINGSLGSPVLVIVKQRRCLILHYNGDNSYLFVNGKDIYKVKASNKSINFPSERKSVV